MRPQTLISALYGEARGYHRLSIRRQVAENERFPRAMLSIRSDRLFQEHVHRSIGRFPTYAERVKAHRGSLPRPGEFVRPEELPVWTRRDQIDFFAAQERPADSHYAHESGGSTGLVVRFHVTRESYEWRTAIMDRVYGWAGAEEGARSLHIWGSTRAASRLHGFKVSIHRALQRRTYFNAYREFTDQERAACCDVINRMKPRAIVGYTGMLVDLARFAREQGALNWKAPTLISTAETLQCGQRELLQAQLANEVFDSYGSREFMNIASECTLHTGYHIAADNLRVEVVDPDGHPVEPCVEGRVVVTDFRNASTPFIRYDVGDRAVMAHPGESCRCGRPFPLLRGIEGRSQDVIFTHRGIVSALNIQDVLEHFEWVEGYQLLQPSRDQLIIKLLSRMELTEERLLPVRSRLRTQLGDLTITFERVNELTRRPNGKIELVSSGLGVA
jgi:phenylacetate-CoA ligase